MKIRKILICLIAILLLAASALGEEVVIPTATLSPEAAALPWNLTLVNAVNPVPEDWTMEFVELKGDQRVDARI